MQTAGGLTEVEQFKNIVIRALPDGSVVRVRDVARVELGADDYQFESRLNGKPAVAIGVYLRPGGNALELAKALKTRMDQLTLAFPREIKWSISYDTTKFVTASVELVKHTFIEAFILVLVVVYLSWAACGPPSSLCWRFRSRLWAPWPACCWRASRSIC